MPLGAGSLLVRRSSSSQLAAGKPGAPGTDFLLHAAHSKGWGLGLVGGFGGVGKLAMEVLLGFASWITEMPLWWWIPVLLVVFGFQCWMPRFG